MDPNANLEELRRIAARILGGDDGNSIGSTDPDAVRLAELVEALDGWISGGGFLPAPWAKGRTS